MKKNPKWSVDNKDPIQIGGWGKVENLVGSVDEMFIAKEAFTADDLKKKYEETTYYKEFSKWKF